MTIAPSLAVTATPSSVANLTLSFSGVTANSYIVVATCASATGLITGVTDDGANTWTKVEDAPPTGSTGRRNDLWTLAAPSATFTTVTVATDHSAQFQASLIEVTGANQASFTDQHASGVSAATTTPPAISITPSVSGTLAIATIQANTNNHSTQVTLPSGWTDLVGYSTQGPKIVYQVNPTSGTVLTPAFVLTSSVGSGSVTANFFASSGSTPISSSDTGTFTDAGESVTAAITSPDTGAGTDAGEHVAATLTDSDTGTGTEGQSVAVIGALPGVPVLDEFVAGFNLYSGIGFGVDITTDPSTWTLTDVSADVLQADGTQGVLITRGRPDEQSTCPPSSLMMTLKNQTGNYTVRRPQSIYWPFVKQGLPIEVDMVTTGPTTYKRFSGYIDDLTPAFDETGNYTTMIVTAHGILQPLGQGDAAVASPLTGSLLTVSDLTGWWALEDAPGSSEADSGLSGGSPMKTFLGTPVFASDNIPAGASGAVSFPAGGSLIGPVLNIGTNSVWRLEWSANFGTGASEQSVIQWQTFGGVLLWEVDITGGQLVFQYQTLAGGAPSPTLTTATFNDGLWHRIRFDAAQSGGGGGPDINITITVDSVVVLTQTLSSLNLGNIRRVVLNPVAAVNPVLFTQVATWAAVTDMIDTFAAAIGYDGEDCITRMTRLCAENTVPFTADGTSSRLMGAQLPDTLLTNLRDCEAVNGGVLEDGVGFGLFMHTSETKPNPAVTVSMTLQQFVPPWNPVENNLLTRNDITVSRPGGGSARFVQPQGLPYSAGGPGGIRTAPDTPSLNVFDDSTLPNRAAWLVHEGTVDADRYTGLAINLAKQTGLLTSWLSTPVGGRLQASGNYSTGGVNGMDVLVEGWTETISKTVYSVSPLNVTPADAWRTFTVQNATLGRIGGFGTTLHTGISNSATSLTVDSLAPWTTTATFPGDFPFDINLDGERVTVGACTGSGLAYTFSSLTRSVNGVVKAHLALAPIDIWRPATVGL
jgi:hypothetical protein